MIHYLNPDVNYTDRSYLNQWFADDVVLMTDVDYSNFYFLPDTIKLLAQWPVEKRITDLTHNAMPDGNVSVPSRLVLSADYTNWYNPKLNFVFFPLYMWAFSQKNTLWFGSFGYDTEIPNTDCTDRGFDADCNKTKSIMCLNNNQHEHRSWLYEEFKKLGTIDHMVYTWKNERFLSNDNFGLIGIQHPVYSECAVNLVIETEMITCSLSEKTCKPFMAYQIPIIVGPPACNKFLQDIGLDMFSDLIPWHTWDTESDQHIKLQKISQFVDQWIRSGTILNDYNNVLQRVQRNKQYFHSKAFRDCIMAQMIKL
jgi:hypothetical protein